MFGDMLQLALRRRLVRFAGRHWLLCYDLGEVDEGKRERYALAVECNEEGLLVLPSKPVQMIKWEGL